jgi:hypothetical protein
LTAHIISSPIACSSSKEKEKEEEEEEEIGVRTLSFFKTKSTQQGKRSQENGVMQE